MTLTETVRQDLTTAMKAGEKDRVGALRLVLSELQKDAKEGAKEKWQFEKPTKEDAENSPVEDLLNTLASLQSRGKEVRK